VSDKKDPFLPPSAHLLYPSPWPLIILPLFRKTLSCLEEWCQLVAGTENCPLITTLPFSWKNLYHSPPSPPPVSSTYDTESLIWKTQVQRWNFRYPVSLPGDLEQVTCLDRDTCPPSRLVGSTDVTCTVRRSAFLKQKALLSFLHHALRFWTTLSSKDCNRWPSLQSNRVNNRWLASLPQR
jgi:hypothetical protein